MSGVLPQRGGEREREIERKAQAPGCMLRNSAKLITLSQKRRQRDEPCDAVEFDIIVVALNPMAAVLHLGRLSDSLVAS